MLWHRIHANVLRYNGCKKPWVKPPALQKLKKFKGRVDVKKHGGRG
jgi:hypothetical protein